MAVITLSHFSGGSNVAPGGTHGDEHLAVLLRSFVTDISQLRTAVTNLAAKLDADGGVTDTDYESTLTTDLGDQQNTLT